MSDVLVRPGNVAQWGNSAAVRIGSAALERAHLHVDDEVDVIAHETMAELLARFDPKKHRHDTIFDMEPAGIETH